MVFIRNTPEGAIFSIRVQPRARRNVVLGEIAGALKLALTAPPIEGRANEACIEFLAGILRVPQSSITIAAGQTNRNKVIGVRGLAAAQLRERLQTHMSSAARTS